MIGLFGKLTAHAGKQQELADQLVKAAKLMEQTPSCHSYIVQTVGDVDVWVTEVWDSQESHDASLQLEGVAELIAETRPFIASIGDSTYTEVVGGKGLV